jgi:hypothetical protein
LFVRFQGCSLEQTAVSRFIHFSAAIRSFTVIIFKGSFCQLSLLRSHTWAWPGRILICSYFPYECPRTWDYFCLHNFLINAFFTANPWPKLGRSNTVGFWGRCCCETIRCWPWPSRFSSNIFDQKFPKSQTRSLNSLMKFSLHPNLNFCLT